MDNKFKETLSCSALPEEFLKSFGFDFTDEIYKFELILEAGKLAKLRVTFNQAPKMVEGIGKISTFAKNYELIEVKK